MHPDRPHTRTGSRKSAFLIPRSFSWGGQLRRNPPERAQLARPAGVVNKRRTNKLTCKARPVCSGVGPPSGGGTYVPARCVGAAL